MARECSLAVVHLRLLARAEFKAVETLRDLLLESADEPLDAVISTREPVLFHEILVDGHGIALEFDLFFDELAIRLAVRAGLIRDLTPGIEPGT
jgi:hypothetical protein